MNEDCSQDADCYVAFIIVIFRSLTTLNRANCRVHSPHRTTNVRQQQDDIWRMLLYLFIVPFQAGTSIYGLLRPSNHTPAPQISTVACNFLNTYADNLERVSLHLQTSHFVFSACLQLSSLIPETMTHNLQLQPLSAVSVTDLKYSEMATTSFQQGQATSRHLLQVL